MADALAFESWVGSETFFGEGDANGNGRIDVGERAKQNGGSSWDICQLGEIFLPGVVTIDKLVVGRDVDVQKRRKKEKARIRDNGLSPVTFDIVLELTAKDWPAFLKIWPYLQPKEGGVRTPLSITHPLVNMVGCNNIYIQKIELPPPTPRKGMRVEMHCGEWFEEEVDAQGPSKKPKPALNPSLIPAYGRPNYFGDPNALAKQLQGNAGFPTGDGAEQNATNNLFEDP